MKCKSGEISSSVRLMEVTLMMKMTRSALLHTLHDWKGPALKMPKCCCYYWTIITVTAIPVCMYFLIWSPPKWLKQNTGLFLILCFSHLQLSKNTKKLTSAVWHIYGFKYALVLAIFSECGMTARAKHVIYERCIINLNLLTLPRKLVYIFTKRNS